MTNRRHVGTFCAMGTLLRGRFPVLMGVVASNLLM